MDSNELNLAGAAGTLAGIAGYDQSTCPWPAGILRDAWLSAYHEAKEEPLHKVLDAGGPLGGRWTETR